MATTKKEPDGAEHPRSHYLYTPDDLPSHWKLRYKNAQGDVDPRLLGACHAALTVGYRGNKVDLEEEDKQRCLQKLRALYKQAGLDWPEDESAGGKKADLGQAAWVLREFNRQTKAGRMHSAATRATVRKIADGMQGHLDALRSHFGVDEQDGSGGEEQDQGAPLSA